MTLCTYSYQVTPSYTRQTDTQIQLGCTAWLLCSGVSNKKCRLMPSILRCKSLDGLTISEAMTLLWDKQMSVVLLVNVWNLSGSL